VSAWLAGGARTTSCFKRHAAVRPTPRSRTSRRLPRWLPALRGRRHQLCADV